MYSDNYFTGPCLLVFLIRKYLNVLRLFTESLPFQLLFFPLCLSNCLTEHKIFLQNLKILLIFLLLKSCVTNEKYDENSLAFLYGQIQSVLDFLLIGVQNYSRMLLAIIITIIIVLLLIINFIFIHSSQHLVSL